MSDPNNQKGYGTQPPYPNQGQPTSSYGQSQPQGVPQYNEYYPPPPGFAQQDNQGYPPTPGTSFTPATYPQTNPNIGFVPPPANTPSPGFRPKNVPYGMLDPENPQEEQVKGFEFSEESIRKGFIRKVYSILSLQLLCTVAFIAIFGYTDAGPWVHRNVALAWVCIAVTFVIIIVFGCIEEARRKAPLNIVLLGFFTLAESYVVAFITLNYDKEDVLLALGLTTIVCVSLTIFAFQTKWDFTVFGGTLFVLLILLVVFGFIAAFFPGKTMILIYSSLGALLFCVYLIYDTQKLMGGEHKYSVSPEEYIMATIALYLDIINIFLHILRIIAAAKKD